MRQYPDFHRILIADNAQILISISVILLSVLQNYNSFTAVTKANIHCVVDKVYASVHIRIWVWQVLTPKIPKNRYDQIEVHYLLLQLFIVTLSYSRLVIFIFQGLNSVF